MTGFVVAPGPPNLSRVYTLMNHRQPADTSEGESALPSTSTLRPAASSIPPCTPLTSRCWLPYEANQKQVRKWILSYKLEQTDYLIRLGCEDAKRTLGQHDDE